MKGIKNKWSYLRNRVRNWMKYSTQILVIPFFSDATDNRIFSFQGIVVLVLMVQNITMLFFAPLLLARLKVRNGWAYLV